jgi:hypothetical protein
MPGGRQGNGVFLLKNRWLLTVFQGDEKQQAASDLGDKCMDGLRSNCDAVLNYSFVVNISDKGDWGVRLL